MTISASILLDWEVSIFNNTYSFTNGTLDPNSPPYSSTFSNFSARSNTTLVSKSTAEVFIDPRTVSFGIREIYDLPVPTP